MSTPSVSAVCPGCKDTLRIPAAWADKAVKCKKCGAVVRATAPVSAPAPDAQLAAPVAPAPFVPQAAAPPPAATPTPTPPAVHPGLPPGYAPPPTGYPYPPPGYGVPPGYPPGYGMPPGYGAPPSYPPGYGVPPGYPPYAPPGYGVPPGYGMPPGYPAPGYPAAPAPAYAPSPAAEPFGGGMQDAPSEDGSRKFRRDDEEDRPAKKKGYKKSSGTGKWVVLGLFAALLLGGGGFAAMKWDTVSGWLGMKKKDKDGTPTDPTDPKANPGPGATPPKPVGPTLTATPTFARRMLFLSSTRYIYCNPLTDGVSVSVPTDPKKKPVVQSELSTAARRIAALLKVPTDKDNNQLYLVTDGGGRLDDTFAASRPMLRAVVDPTLAEFCKSCRPQDRAVIYFGGHAFAKDGKGYLVPADGDMQETDSPALIPLEDFWKLLAECPAQQKVVLFDVCRLNEDDDAVRPGSEKMSKELEDLLHAPPKGVEVVTACSEGQTAREYRRAPDRLTPAGSVFLHALRDALKAGKEVPAPVAADDPIPVAEWVATAQAKIGEKFGGKAQTLKHTAGAKSAAVAATADPAPKRFEYAAAPKGADAKEVKAVFEALTLAPIKIDEDTREDGGLGDSLGDVVFFPADALQKYKTDMTMEEAEKQGEKFPVRAAAAKSLKFIREKWSKEKGTSVQTRFIGEANDAVKKDIKSKQVGPATLDVELRELADDMDKAKEMLDKEDSMYWQAMFLYAYAQTKARLAFVNEYNLSLGRILTESLPEFEKSLGLQLVSVEKMESKKDIKEMATSAKETFAELIAKHKDTPWAVMAKQYRVVSLGLKWQEYKPPVMQDKSKDD